jgi:hypothetical protein
MYTDMRPNLAVNGRVLRYYIGKVSNNVRLSNKSPTHSWEETSWDTCRETTATSIMRSLITKGEMVGKRTKPYIIMPIASARTKDGKVVTGTTNIFLEFDDDNAEESEDEARKYHGFDHKLTKNALNSVVSILGVLLSSGNEEITRRKHKVGLPSDITIEEDKDGSVWGDIIRFKYSVLSPAWITHPITVSLILGTLRNTISVCLTNPDIVKSKLLDDLKMSEIERIIMTCDRQKALQVYKENIIPFFTSKSVSDTENYLSQKEIRDRISPIINHGLFSIFRPEKTAYYWSCYGSHYGLESLTEYDYKKMDNILEEIESNCDPINNKESWKCRYQ